MSRNRERGCRVFIGRLPHRADKRDIEKFFKGYGRIQDIHLKLGYAFIEFDDPDDAYYAVHELNNKDLLGDRVTVEHARPSKSGGHRSGGGSYDRGRRDYGGRSGGGGFTFRDKYGSPYNTEWKVIVENLSTRAGWQDLKDYMRQVGDVTFSQCHKDRAGEGIVEFACEDDMKRAIRKLDGTELMGKRIKLIETEIQYSYNFDDLREGDRIGLICDDNNRLHIIVNDIDKGFVDHDVSTTKYAMLDLYGRCEQLAIVPCNKIPELMSADCSQEDVKNDRREEEKVSADESKDKILSCQNCEYKKRCERFKVTLGIPEQYFTKNVTCYCSKCCDARGEHRVTVCGDPPQEYARPIGWCKFELRLPPNLNSVQLFSQNHLAYTVVHVGSIRRTLDRGTVLPPRKSNHVISGHGDQKIVVSPSIARAMALTNEKKFLFTDATSGKRSSTQVAFEIRLPSEGYTKSTPSSETKLDARDWCLELPAKIVLSGLLVQICEEDR